MIKHFEIRVYGRVQGVGFRFAAQNQARSLSLKGWVENHGDGSVIVAVQGDEPDCMAFIQWCKTGTGYSWVERIELTEKKTEEFRGFYIRN